MFYFSFISHVRAAVYFNVWKTLKCIHLNGQENPVGLMLWCWFAVLDEAVRVHEFEIISVDDDDDGDDISWQRSIKVWQCLMVKRGSNESCLQITYITESAYTSSRQRLIWRRLSLLAAYFAQLTTGDVSSLSPFVFFSYRYLLVYFSGIFIIIWTNHTIA